MFWNWASAAQRRHLSVRAERASKAMRLAFENGTLDEAPRAFVDELLASTQELAAVAPADLAAAVERAERLVARLPQYGWQSAPSADVRSARRDRR